MIIKFDVFLAKPALICGIHIKLVNSQKGHFLITADIYIKVFNFLMFKK
jgi:hypothetical protein